MASMAKTHDDVFLSSSASDRLNLYKTILELRASQVSVGERLAAQRKGETLVKEVNLRAVAATTERNYGSIYNIYNDLLLVLGEIAGDPHADLATLFAIPVADVRLHMIKQTDAWHFLQAVLSGEFANFEEFAASLHLSRLTVLRHLKPLKHLAEHFGIQMHPESLKFSGSERQIRLFMMIVIWKATSGAQWPFDYLSQSSAARLMDTLYLTLDCQPTNPVARQLAMYYLAITYRRVLDGHVLAYDRNKAVLDYPLPSLDLALGHGRFADFQLPPMTRNQLMGETEFGFFLLHFEPVFLVGSDTQLPIVVERFRRYAPGIYRLVTGFVAAFSEWLPHQDDGQENVLIADLLAVTSSVVALGTDFNALVAYAFNRNLQQRQEDPQYLRAIRQTLTQVMLGKHLENFIELIDPLAENYYRNFIQLRAAYHPREPLKVALVLEQTILEYVDLMAMISQQSFVELQPNQCDLAHVDLVIKSSALPLDLPKNVTQFTWEPGPTPDRFGELYAVLMSLWWGKSASIESSRRRA